MIIDMTKIRKSMTIVSSDDCPVGIVANVENAGGMLRVVNIAEGFGYDFEIPLSWVSEVADCVYLDKSATFIVAHRQRTPRSWRASDCEDSEFVLRRSDLLALRQRL